MIIRLISSALCILSVSVHADTFDLKPGAWEVTTSNTVSGMPIPQDSLNELTPAQRAKLEEAMRARSGKVTTHTSQTCLTKEDLAHADLLKSDESNCKRTVITQSARHLEVQEICSAPEASKSDFKFDSKSPESYAATIDRAMGNGQVHTDLTGKWVAAVCSKKDQD